MDDNGVRWESAFLDVHRWSLPTGRQTRHPPRTSGCSHAHARRKLIEMFFNTESFCGHTHTHTFALSLPQRTFHWYHTTTAGRTDSWACFTMEDACSRLMSHVERLHILIRSRRSEGSAVAPEGPSTAEPAATQTLNKKESCRSGLWWWVSSMMFGLSSAIIYHLVKEEIHRRQLRLAQDSSSARGWSPSHFHAMVARQARQLSQWTRIQVRNMGHQLQRRSPSELTLHFALGTSLLLPDHVTVPWVLGCLALSNSLWGTWRPRQSRPVNNMVETYPPYLFLCFCPGAHRFQLWIAWTGLQLLGQQNFARSLSSSNGNQPSQEATKKTVRSASSSSVEQVVEKTKGKDSSKASSSRYLEIMVHNVSHTDIILGLDPPSSVTNPDAQPSSVDDPYCLCRPRFSFMDVYCRVVLEALTGKEEVVEFPRYQRSEEDPRYLIKDNPTVATPAGLGLLPDPSLMADMAEVRVRGRDLSKFDASLSKFPINFVFFPLLATILPHWRVQIQERQYPRHVKRVLILVTGVGTPRNWTHSVTGNSTEVCAQVMEQFLKRIDPELTVVRIHSQTNIFRYDENLRFVDKEFAPVMNAWRDAHARDLPYPDEAGSAVASENPFDPDWRNSMSVTLSAADGSTARTHAIRESLRPFRPTYFHFWQLKTFWHETKIVDDDLEVHSYETMETLPAVDTERLRDEHLQLLVDEMKAFREEMMEVLLHGKHDFSKFWLRKTHKPVLAVLLVQSPGMPRPVLYRGTNMEVSMPTGSLCAERNVIGTALASNPQLKREDLKLIAVLAFPTLDEMHDKPMHRVDSTASVGSTTLDSNPDGQVDRRISIGSEAEAWIFPTEQQLNQPRGLDQSFAMVPPPSDDNHPPTQPTQGGTDSTPVRKIRLFSKSAGRHKHKRSVVVQNSRDLNPLRPCGACNEWLKKIAESNPYFKIVTFTDANLHGVYCTPCQQ